MKFTRQSLSTKADVGTLNWWGGGLIDLAGGGHRYFLDGSEVPAPLHWGGPPFDLAVISATGLYAALCQRLGTKGLLLSLSDGRPKILRELNRSYYRSNVYEYPVAFATAPDGREKLIHCPEDYCRLEIEDVISGAFQKSPLGNEREPGDAFHSRLAVSPSGHRFMSAGWVWHPMDVLGVYDFHKACEDPSRLDKAGEGPSLEDWGEVSSAAFSDDDHVVISENSPAVVWGLASDRDTACHIGVVSLKEDTIVSRCSHPLAAGLMMPLDREQIVAFYKHPKVVHLPTGSVVVEWPDISSGMDTSSIIHHHDRSPPIALDPANKRFAIAQEKEITVVTFQ